MDFSAFLKKRDADIAQYQREGHRHADGTFHHGQGTHGDSTPSVKEPKNSTPVEAPKEETHKVPKVAPKKLYTGPLTFHEELLKTNPVEALRKQTEERGHWSVKWIPPFPLDDTEAQEYARAIYLRKYYIQTYGDKLDTPEYEKESKVFDEARAIDDHMYATIMSYPYGARQMDLLKLTWFLMDAPPSYPHLDPSEYFGDAKTRDLLKSLGMWDY